MDTQFMEKNTVCGMGYFIFILTSIILLGSPSSDFCDPKLNRRQEIRSGSDPPFLRIAYSPALARLRLGDPEDVWEVPMKRIAEQQDDALLVITERTMTDIYQDEERLELYGFTSVVPSQSCNFPSPLTLFDEVRSEEDNPIGLTIWNMALCALKAAPGASGKPRVIRGTPELVEDKVSVSTQNLDDLL